MCNVNIVLWHSFIVTETVTIFVSIFFILRNVVAFRKQSTSDFCSVFQRKLPNMSLDCTICAILRVNQTVINFSVILIIYTKIWLQCIHLTKPLCWPMSRVHLTKINWIIWLQLYGIVKFIPWIDLF